MLCLLPVLDPFVTVMSTPSSGVHSLVVSANVETMFECPRVYICCYTWLLICLGENHCFTNIWWTVSLSFRIPDYCQWAVTALMFQNFLTTCLGVGLSPFTLLIISGVVSVWRLTASAPGNFLVLFFWSSSSFRCSPRSILRIYYIFFTKVFFFVFLSDFFWEIFYLYLSCHLSEILSVVLFVSKSSSLPFFTSSYFLFVF